MCSESTAARVTEWDNVTGGSRIPYSAASASMAPALALRNDSYM